MPVYRCPSETLDKTVAKLEQRGQTITQVLLDPDTIDGMLIVTELPRNTTGNPWLPSSETRTA